jgi:hypothetical protein
MLLSGVLIGRMPYRANEGRALVSGVKLYKRDYSEIVKSLTNLLKKSESGKKKGLFEFSLNV